MPLTAEDEIDIAALLTAAAPAQTGKADKWQI